MFKSLKFGGFQVSQRSSLLLTNRSGRKYPRLFCEFCLYFLGFQIEKYDPIDHLRSKAVREKFLDKNKDWMLDNLDVLLTGDVVDQHRQFIEFSYKNLVQMKLAGRFSNQYDVSDDSSDHHKQKTVYVMEFCAIFEILIVLWSL